MQLPDPLYSRRSDWLTKSAWALAPAALLAVGATGMRYALRRFLRRPLPSLNGPLPIDGLSQPVEVIRDKWGVPHIYAQNETDLFFAQGFVHAQDRLFQMDTYRRAGLGRLAEVVGPPALTSDRFARYFGWPQAAAAQLGQHDAATSRLLDAYVAGVNAFIARGNLPVEMSLLAYKPEPWTHLAISAMGTMLGWGLSVNWDTELLRSLLIAELGPEKAFDLTPTYDSDYTTIYPAETIGARLAESLLTAFQEATAALPLAKAPVGNGIGSNNWVVSGQHTVSGRPILANDPHLPPLFPAIWYENHLVGGQFNVTGFAFPGVPGVVIGHNERVSWGVTNSFVDGQDLYMERFHPDDDLRYEIDGEWHDVEVREEVIKVRGRKPVVEKVRYTRHGPVISDLLEEQKTPVSLRWISYEKNAHMKALLNINRAGDWGEFRDAMRDWGFPSQNILYADIDGHLGHILPGRIPARGRGKGLLPVPGWDSQYEWAGWIPFEELPQRTDPACGYIVTANNLIVGDEYPHLLTGEWLPDARARRIVQLLQTAVSHTLLEHGRIQNDIVSLPAQEFMRLVMPHTTPADFPSGVYDAIISWDGRMDAARMEPSLYFGWKVTLMRLSLIRVLGEPLVDRLLTAASGDIFDTNKPFQKIAPELVLRWLKASPPDWIGPIEPLIRPALLETLRILAETMGPDPGQWVWGQLHQVDLHNYFVRIPGLGRYWKPQTLSVSGDGNTINNHGVAPHFPPRPVDMIPSCRMLIDVGDWDACLVSIPGGQSGHPASGYYQNGLADWAAGKYRPMLFSRAKIEAESAGVLHLKPPG